MPTVDRRKDFWNAVSRELDHAYRKHGCGLWGRHEFMAVIKEEFDEAWDVVKADGSDADLHCEIIQIAAVCLRYLETADRYRGAHPPVPMRSALGVA